MVHSFDSQKRVESSIPIPAPTSSVKTLVQVCHSHAGGNGMPGRMKVRGGGLAFVFVFVLFFVDTPVKWATGWDALQGVENVHSNVQSVSDEVTDLITKRYNGFKA